MCKAVGKLINHPKLFNNVFSNRFSFRHVHIKQITRLLFKSGYTVVENAPNFVYIHKLVNNS